MFVDAQLCSLHQTDSSAPGSQQLDPITKPTNKQSTHLQTKGKVGTRRYNQGCATARHHAGAFPFIKWYNFCVTSCNVGWDSLGNPSFCNSDFGAGKSSRASCKPSSCVSLFVSDGCVNLSQNCSQYSTGSGSFMSRPSIVTSSSLIVLSHGRGT